MKELSLQNCRLDGRYDIQALLGRGSYAEIYVARDILAAPGAPHSQVVIKALNVFMQDDLDADLERTLVENFQNEAIALDRVRHPNIISRLGHGTAQDLNGMVFHYLVLEYLSGGDLAKNCPKTGMPVEKVLGYLEQVCAGLAHAHKCGVIHRDIKPQNLLLTGDRKTVKIADFGVARFSQNDAPITRVGTNMYAPPEHSPMFADGNVATIVKLTPAADVYSLAKSVYVLITGESPRRFSNFPISELPDSFRQKPWANEFLRVLRRATQNDPLERPQTVNEFWQELSRVNFFTLQEEADEPETQISKPRPHLVPQPSITPDYSPNAPLRPKFDTSRELKFKNETLEEPSPPLVVKLNGNNNSQLEQPPKQPISETVSGKPIVVDFAPASALTKSPLVRRSLIIALFLMTFAGGLFITQNYLRNSQLLPEFQNPFGKYPEGVAVQDINLRSTPGVERPPVGLVPKGARVRITETKDNWIKIDIIEPPRPENSNEEKSGWVNKRYIDVQE